MASINVTFDITKTSDSCYNLHASAANASGFDDAAIFKIEVLPKSNDQTVPSCRFAHVCDYQDMQDYHYYTPTSGEYPTVSQPYFRQAQINLIMRSADICTQVKSSLQAQVQRLINEASATPTTVSSQTITFTAQ